MSAPSDAAEPDASFDAVGDAKHLLRTLRVGALGTLEPKGSPFTSLTAVATTPEGRPILLLSRLAAHTGHLTADPRCSLLLARQGRGDPLAHPRLILVGAAQRLAGSEREAARARFLARNPKAELYADFPDFGFWQITTEAAHLNGGFGRAARLDGQMILTDLAGADSLLDAERSAVDHMNDNHADALALYATVLAGQPAGPWRASGLDPEGLDLVCGDLTARIGFAQPVHSPEALRAALVALARHARQDDAARG